MVERVARAIWAEKDTKGPLPGLFTWEKVSEVTKERVRAQARAAIEAMREPTDAMKVAGGVAWEDEFFGQHGIIFDAAGRAWTAQVSAALSEADDPLPETKGLAAARSSQTTAEPAT